MNKSAEKLIKPNVIIEDYPKQFIDVMGIGRSLIQLIVDRLKPICPVENMWVVTNENTFA